MNNKHIAAILIIAVGLCLFQVTLSLKKQTEEASNNADFAETEASNAEFQKNLKTKHLQKTKDETAKLRA